MSWFPLGKENTWGHLPYSGGHEGPSKDFPLIILNSEKLSKPHILLFVLVP